MKKILIILTVLGLIFLYFHEKRDYHYLDKDHCITVWKRFGGHCYIVPGKYTGWLAPDKDYLLTDNRNAITIVYDPESSEDYIISNDYGFPIKLDTTTIKLKLYSSKQRQQYVNRVYEGHELIQPPKKYVMLDIKEGYVILNGIEL